MLKELVQKHQSLSIIDVLIYCNLFNFLQGRKENSYYIMRFGNKYYDLI